MSDDSVAQQAENSSREQIAARAYQLWEERGRPMGSPEEDWSQAETEIREEEAAREEWVRLRNAEVRAHHHTYKDESLPPFTEFAGAL